MTKEYDAHISEDGTRRQSVAAHCQNVAALAAGFGAPFGGAECARLAGMLHDIGKFSDEFQVRIHAADPAHAPRVDHSTAGAVEAMGALHLPPVALAVAGHHAGLPDAGNPLEMPGGSTLFSRIKNTHLPDCSAWKQVLTLPDAHLPAFCMKDNITLAFFTRMLYSCLVDADFLDTEAFMQNGGAVRGGQAELPDLLERVRAKADRWLASPGDKSINHKRCAILQACIEMGRTGTPGLFTLTVPTGGGKTFDSLIFSMEHAIHTGKRRIVYVIPYTSIIEQTADKFVEILGEENVLAHYSGAEYMLKQREDLTPIEYRKLLSAENWDAPVIVTTAVQFFESLYGNRSSRCRKLHNLADSVIIFDEAQTLPVNYLRPCVSAIGQLVQHYGVSAVLCTATQPELGTLFDEYAPGFPLREICPGSGELYRDFRRTTLRDRGELTQEALEKELAAQGQVLCVVNRRRTAQELFAAMPQEGRYCLTTLLTPADRRTKLDEIRTRLKNGQSCRVISTSLIEAGVDVDFTTVYREITGLDSVLQAAGRCNREGLHSAAESVVHIFRLTGVGVPPMQHQNVDAFEAVCRTGVPLDGPEAIARYFQTLLGIKGDAELDKKNILEMLERGTDTGAVFPFATIAKEFSLIDTPTRTIYIPRGKGAALCDQLRAGARSRQLFRALGNYSVSVYTKQFEALDNVGALALLDEDAVVLTDLTKYDGDTGLTMDIESGQGVFI